MRAIWKVTVCIFMVAILMVPISSMKNEMSGNDVGITKQSEENHISQKTTHLQFSKPYIMESNGYSSLDIEGTNAKICHSGNPALPVYTTSLSFPLGTKIIDISCDIKEIKSMDLSEKVMPAPRPIIAGKNAEYKMDTVYDSNEFFPDNWFSYSTGGGVDENGHKTFVTIKVYPARYSPVSNTIHYAENIDLKIKYIEGEESCKGNDGYDMVIITPSEFCDELQPLIEHKNKFGVSTVLKTTEDIYAEYDGVDQAEKIKYFIKDAIEQWGIKYILLVGSIDKLPMRESAVQCSVFSFKYVLTDLYYADIYDANGSFCSWDSNHNEKFGEFIWDWSNDTIDYIDSVDLYPDVGIGRLPCSNSKEVQVMVDKIITYESQSYGKEWFKRLILMGGDTFPTVWEPEGEAVTEYVEQVMPDFESVKLWTSLNTFNPFSINQEISSGAGFVSYSGHGFEYGIATSPPYKERRIYYLTPYLLILSNGYKLPVIFFDACLTTSLDFSVLGKDLPCFAWFAVKKPDGGAIATIGSSRMAYGGYAGNPLGGGSCRMNANFFDAYEPGITLSQMLMEAQNAYLNDVWKDCLTLEEFNLLGDPSLKIGGYP